LNDRARIEAAYADLDLIEDAAGPVGRTIAALDQGEIRVAEKIDGEWVVNEWVKEAILLYFRLAELETSEVGPVVSQVRIRGRQGYVTTFGELCGVLPPRPPSQP